MSLGKLSGHIEAGKPQGNGLTLSMAQKQLEIAAMRGTEGRAHGRVKISRKGATENNACSTTLMKPVFVHARTQLTAHQFETHAHAHTAHQLHALCVSIASCDS